MLVGLGRVFLVVATLAVTCRAFSPGPVGGDDPSTDEKVFCKAAYLLAPDRSVRNITPTPGEGWYGTPCIHPPAESVVFAGATHGAGRIWKYSVASEAVISLTPPSSCAKQPSFSSDGKFVVFASDRDLEHPRFDMREVGRTRPHDDGFKGGMTGPSNLYIMEADGTNVRQLTRGDHFDSRPVFSPDGQRVVFLSNRVGERTLYLWTVPADGSSRPARIGLRDNPWVGRPCFSPDGEELFFFTGLSEGAYAPRGRHTLCRVKVGSDEWRPVVGDNLGVSSHGPFVDPSGELLWYHASVGRQWRVLQLSLTSETNLVPVRLPGFDRAHVAHATSSSNGFVAFDSRSFLGEH